MRLIEGTKLDFDDILVVPQYSNLVSRKDAILKRKFKFKHSKQEAEYFPLVVANMDSVGTFSMAKALAKHDALVALHKYYAKEDLVNFFYDNRTLWKNVFYTIGTNPEDLRKLSEVSMDLYCKTHEISGLQTPQFWVDAEQYMIRELNFPNLICVDVANGHTSSFVGHVSKIRNKFPNSIIMAGNVVTGDMAKELILHGADIVKVGIGGGSCCLTRLVAGVGYPQLSAADECAFDAHGVNGHICSDGGITKAADAAKAFCVGADFIMCGGIFAGTDECDGEWIEKDGQKFLKFHGMSSKEAQEKWNGGLAAYRASEGKEVPVLYKGSANDVIQNIIGGIRSNCLYIGASKLKDMPKCAQFVRVNRTHNTIFGE